MPLSSAVAQKIVADALAEARRLSLSPMAVVVLDARGALAAAATEDNASLMRWKIAFAKANGALSLGVGSRKIGAMAVERPHFVAAAAHLAGGDGLVPVAGGVLIREGGAVIGAVGVSGDTSDHDEMAAVAAITAAGFQADGG